MKLHYRIRHHLEEDYCGNCGESMMVGDEGVEGDRGAYCCEACWEEGEGHNDGLMVVDHSEYPD